MIRKVVINTASQLVAKGFTASSSLIVTILIGRALGEAGFGQFTKIFVFVGYFYTFVDFGLNSIYVREAKKEDEIRSLKVLFGLRLFLAAFFALSAIIIAYFLPYDQQAQTGFPPLVKLGIFIASLTIFSQAVFTSANAYFQKNLKYYFSTFASVASAITVLSASLIFYLTGSGVLSYTSAYVAGGAFLASVAVLLLVKVTGKNLLPIFSKTESLKLLCHAWPVGLSLVLNIVYFKVDVFILSNFRSTEEVGLYGLAYQFFEASLTLPIFFANSIYPVLNESYRVNIEVFKKNLKFWLISLSVISLLLTATLFIGAYLIPFIYDGKFTGSVKALQILSLGMPFFFLSAILWHVFIVYKQQKKLVYIYLAGALLNLFANILLIPKIGYLAAASVTVASEAFIFVLMVAFLAFPKSSQSSHLM